MPGYVKGAAPINAGGGVLVSNGIESRERERRFSQGTPVSGAERGTIIELADSFDAGWRDS